MFTLIMQNIFIFNNYFSALSNDLESLQDALSNLEPDATLSVAGKPADAEAVGNKLSVINSAIKTEYSTITITLESGKYTGNVEDVIAKVTDSNWKRTSFAPKAGREYKVTFRSIAYENPAVYIWLCDDGDVIKSTIESIHTSVEMSETTFITSSDIAIVYIRTYSKSSSGTILTVEESQTYIDKIEKDLKISDTTISKLLNTKMATFESGYINVPVVGNEVTPSRTQNSHVISSVFSVSEGDTLCVNIVGAGNTSAGAIGFCATDENFVVLRRGGARVTYENSVIRILADEKYVILNHVITNGFEPYAYIGTDIKSLVEAFEPGNHGMRKFSGVVDMIGDSDPFQKVIKNSSSYNRTILRYGNRYVINGKDSVAWFVKLNGNLEYKTSSATVDSDWADKGMSFITGHKYHISFNIISGLTDKDVRIDVYKAGTHSDVSFGVDDGREFTAQSGFTYIICAVLLNNANLTNAVYDLIVTDEYDSFLHQIKLSQVYKSRRRFAPQAGVVSNGAIYVYSASLTGLYKMDIATHTETFYEMDLGHGNGMTIYNNKLYVPRMDNETGRISIINMETCEIESYLDFSIEGHTKYITAITYDALHDQFILAMDNEGYAFTDTSFNLIKFVPITEMGDGVGQGMTCDGISIYRVRYSPSTLDVYDYDGNLLQSMKINSGDEPQNLYYDWSGGWWFVFNDLDEGLLLFMTQLRKNLDIDNIFALSKCAALIG